MRTVYIKNNTQETKTWYNLEFAADQEQQIAASNPALLAKFASHDPLLVAIANGEALVGNGLQYFTTISEQIDWLKGDVPPKIDSNITNKTPFADPIYRTKYDGIDAIVEIAPGAAEDMDFQLVEERYIKGGRIVYANAQLGDHVHAEVYDKDGVIPEEFRAALCENWPTVAAYIDVTWINPTSGELQMDTAPLIAKVPAGLYFRLRYHACAEGTTRKVAVTYFLLKEL